ncbi:unnamed protein product [Alternaria burnsii]|nr:unnamed protein product [Alternaria burnsii]
MSSSVQNMVMLLTWTLLCVHLPSVNAALILHFVRQNKPRILNSSDGLSIEALLTLIGLCVAIVGVGLTLVLKWNSLKRMCLARRYHHRSRRNNPDSEIRLVGLSRRSPAPPSSIDDVSDDQIARPSRVQTCPAEQQRVFLRIRLSWVWVASTYCVLGAWLPSCLPAILRTIPRSCLSILVLIHYLYIATSTVLPKTITLVILTTGTAPHANTCQTKSINRRHLKTATTLSHSYRIEDFSHLETKEIKDWRSTFIKLSLFDNMLVQPLFVNFAYCFGIICALPIESPMQRERIESSIIQSQSLSVEAVVGVIAVVVAIFGIALPFIWPHLRSRLDSRRHARSRSRSTTNPHVSLHPWRHAMPLSSIASHAAAGLGETVISRPQRAQSDNCEQQRGLIRRTLTF